MNILEYICLDNENKFRSKIVLTEKNIDDIESLIVDSSLIDNLIDSSYDIVLIPTKVIKNPFYRDDRHWLVLCEYKYQSGVVHKKNTRFQLEQIIQDNPDIEVSIIQELVICDKTSPLGWNDNLNIFKNYSGKIEFSQYSETIINELIDAVTYSGLRVKELMMTRIVGKWMIQLAMNNAMEACDDLILFRYIIQKICFNHNVICCLNPNPITNSSIFSQCNFYISMPNMRDPEHGLQYIVEACEKLKLKHLEHYKMLSKNNGKQFTYSQNNINSSVQVILGEKQNGMIKENRCGADCDPYHVLSVLLKTITSSYNIDTMSHDLDSLKERFNYHGVVLFDTEKPKIQHKIKSAKNLLEKSEEILSEKSQNKTSDKPPEKKTGLSGLASILRLNEDSDDENSENKNDSKEENEKNRVDSIIKSLKKMNLSHNILNSVTAPKSVKSSKETMVASEAILPQGPEAIIPTQFTHNASIPMTTYMPTPKSSLYTLPSQIN